MKTQFDVIIATRNRGALVTNTLRSLQASTYEEFKVWIIDQSNDEATCQAVKPIIQEDGRFFFLHTPTKGVNIARNLGINIGIAPLVALTDDDCSVSQTWLADLLAEYETHPDIDSVFGRVSPGTISPSTVGDGNIEQIKYLQQILPMAKIDHAAPVLFSKNRINLGFGHGANMSFRRTAFKKFGLFDEYLGVGAPLRSWPERDLGYRILAGGGEILYSPDAVVYHDHWREWKGVHQAYRNYAIGAGAAVGKYIRIGDWASIQLLMDWFLQQGFRQIFSGIFKWRSWQKTYVGFMQLAYPWLGLIYGMKYAIDPQGKVYAGLKSEQPLTPQQLTNTCP